MDGDQLFVRTPEEMYAAFPGFEDAVARSQEIADRVEIDLDLRSGTFPVFAPHGGETADYLVELCLAGVKRYDKITDG